MAGTKTGIGGFEIDGKVYDFDVGDPNAPGDPKSKLPGPDKGDIKVDNTKKDISKGTRTTLSQYLKTVTAANSYPNDGDYHEAKITDDNGLPHPLSGDPVNTPQFTKPENTKGVSVGPGGDPATQLQTNLSKGKEAPKVDPAKPGDRMDGHTLLPSVTKDNPPKVITGYTSAVLANNRFSDASRASADVTGLGNDNKPPADYNPSLHHPRYGDVSLKRLAQVGTALSLRASQELNAASAGNNPTSGGQELAALLPGFNQLGASRVNTTVLEARDVLESLTTDEVPDGDFTNIADVSWGSLNNVDDPYSGILALGMIALSTALTAAIVLLIEGLGFLLGLIKGSTGDARNISGRYVLGRYHVVKAADPNAFPPALPPDFGALLGLRATAFPFASAVKTGVEAFFGIDTSGGIGGALLSGLSSATQNPGFNSIVARTIIRSGIVIVDAFKKAFSSPNIVAGIKNILNIIDVIRSSKLIAAMNAFAMIGDLTLTDPGDVVAAPDAIPEEPIKKSRIDGLPDDGNFTSVQKNRLKGEAGTLHLAWASNRAPAMYLIPESILGLAAADDSLGAFRGPAAISDPNGLSKAKYVVQTGDDAKTNGARIPRVGSTDTDPDTVKSFEAKLDAEYVPFSFHDLRTNEIISFHAFLASMSDDYTVNWDTVEGYGRVDPVKIYKSTQRKIGMSFYVISTNEHDFDEMWMKINKLTTLAYPQYTRGRMLINKDKSLQFVQPFSQLMGASPVIRLRLGDLFRSNYSRFALARLFGLGGTDPLQFGGDPVNPSTGAAGNLAKVQAALKSPTPDMTFNLGSDQWPQADSGGLSLSPPLPLVGGSDAPKQAPTLFIDLHDAPYINIKIDQGVTSGQLVHGKVTLMTAADISTATGMDIDAATKIADSLTFKYDNEKDVKHRIVGDAAYTIPLSYLKPTKATLDKLFKDNFATDNQTIQTVSDFLDTNKNAIIRSFNSIKGKGLAGVIESMNFDWYDKVTWETKPGSTAPKLCRVTVSFAPIHDISPGIDHLGYNRSPIYPVGHAMQMGIDKESAKDK